MINRSVKCFLEDTYGQQRWKRIAAAAALDAASYEPVLHFAPGQTEAMLKAAQGCLGKPREMLLEDLGTYLVSHPHMQALRRLLRFGGPTFLEFLYSLDELPDRARLAIPDLSLPRLMLEDHEGGSYILRVLHPVEGFGHVVVGILRALADDYGDLVLLEHRGRVGQLETIAVELAEAAFAEGRSFDLGVQAG